MPSAALPFPFISLREAFPGPPISPASPIPRPSRPLPKLFFFKQLITTVNYWFLYPCCSCVCVCLYVGAHVCTQLWDGGGSKDASSKNICPQGSGLDQAHSSLNSVVGSGSQGSGSLVWTRPWGYWRACKSLLAWSGTPRANSEKEICVQGSQAVIRDLGCGMGGRKQGWAAEQWVPPPRSP